MKRLIEAIACTVGALKRCQKTGNAEWTYRHRETLKRYEAMLPSGTGFDAGTTINVDASCEEKVVLVTQYHHMNQDGYYDGWSPHQIAVTPSFVSGFDMSIGGRDRNDIKAYMADVFSEALRVEVE